MTKTIIANFKMNGSKEFIHTYFDHLDTSSNNTVIICPPSLYLDQTYQCINQKSSRSIHLGGQNCSHQSSGALTGEISATMLADVGCRYVILGHSERRTLHGETSSLIKQKTQQALDANLIPIICVGESLEQRQKGLAEKIIEEQLTESIPHLSNPSSTYLIAYEPIWAIGTGLTATKEDIEAMHTFIRQHPTGQNTSILYGGSVNGNNAAEILTLQNVDGVLVGGASLKIEEFNRIINQRVS